MLMWFVIYPPLPICYVHMYICVCVGRKVVVFWIMIMYAQNRNIGKANKLKVLMSNKPKGLNRLAN
jgi:hypothetical protein